MCLRGSHSSSCSPGVPAAVVLVIAEDPLATLTDSLSFSVGLYQMNYPALNYYLVYFYRDVWMEGSAIRAILKNSGGIKYGYRTEPLGALMCVAVNI